MNNSSAEPVGRVEPENQGPQRGRYMRLVLFAAIVALSVVIVAVLLTPPDESAPVKVPDKRPTAKTVPPASVVLASKPAEVSNEALQTELTEEIESLQSEFPQSPRALHVAAGAYVKLHQTDKARKLWKKCIELDPRHLGPRLGLATIMSEKGEDAQAIDMLKKALAAGNASAELYYRLASACSKVGEVEKAESVIQSGVEAFPGVGINWLLLGQIQNQLQKYEAAERSLRKSIELGEESSDVYFALANACQRQGKSDEAVEYRKRFSELKEQESGPSEGQPFQAVYQQALRPVVVSSLLSAAVIHVNQGKDEAAEQLFLRANALAPDNRQVLEELVSYYRKQGRVADAVVVQERLVELAPKNLVYRLNLATVASRIGEWTTAESALQKARQLAPDHVLPYIGLAHLRLQTGNLREAREYAQQAIECRPTARGYALLALICRQQGDTKAAKAAQQAAGRLTAPGAQTVDQSQ